MVQWGVELPTLGFGAGCHNHLAMAPSPQNRLILVFKLSFWIRIKRYISHLPPCPWLIPLGCWSSTLSSTDTGHDILPLLCLTAKKKYQQLLPLGQKGQRSLLTWWPRQRQNLCAWLEYGETRSPSKQLGWGQTQGKPNERLEGMWSAYYHWWVNTIGCWYRICSKWVYGCQSLTLVAGSDTTVHSFSLGMVDY